MRAERAGVIDAPERDVGRRQLLLQRRDIRGAEHRGDARVGLVAAAYALHVGGESRIGGQRRVAQDFLGQHAPFAVALDRDQNWHAVA
jgi:hypothetical protein